VNQATEHQVHLLHHTLGVTPQRRAPYRNHFVASRGHDDLLDLKALEAAGLMARSRTPKFCDPDDMVFHVTDAGRDFALENLPQPPKRTRYEEYLDADTGHSFVEFLGINPPRVEWNREWGNASRYRYVRLDWRYRQEVIGEWKPSKKEAKASYKAALKKHNDEARAWQRAPAQQADDSQKGGAV
jgi:hypothetical protein